MLRVKLANGIAHIGGNDSGIYGRSPDVRVRFVLMSCMAMMRVRSTGMRTVNTYTLELDENLNVGIVFLSLIYNSHLETDISDEEIRLALFEVHQVIHAWLVGLWVAALR